MTIVNILEDSNNPNKYLIISSQDGTSESIVTTNVFVTSTSNNRLDLIEITKIPGDKGDKGDKGDIGPPGQDGLVFTVLPVSSGGTSNTSFITDKVIYYDGTQLVSSDLDINSIQTDIISNINAGNGLSKVQNGDEVTLNTNLGNGLTIVGDNQIGVDTNVVITKSTFDLSNTSFYQGILPIAYGGTNNTFFGLNSLIYYDGSKLATYPIPTGGIVHSGQQINIIAGSGLVGGGDITLPNGSVVIKLQNSDDITVFDDRIELSEIITTGTFTKVNVNSKGRVIGGSNITLNDVVTALGGMPWTSSTDGSGSGMDADLLDGQHGSFYRDAANISGTISTGVLPNIVSPATASKVQFNAKGLIIGTDFLTDTEITDALGYVPFDESGGTIFSNVEILGNLIADSATFDNNTITIGSPTNTNDIRGIRFRYNDVPAKHAVLAYYPAEGLFRISAESPGTSGIILTQEKADSKYVAVTGEQQISGIKTFLDNLNVYSRIIIRNPYPELSPLDIGSNSTLVQFLNADLLDGQHISYYRNAVNLTGILNTGVIIPHIQNRATVTYSNINNPDDGFVEYFPVFHRPSSGHPMVLRSSNVYHTGYNIHMKDSSLSVGFNILDDNISNSLVVGTNNSGSALATNSLAVGSQNIISGENSIALNYRSSAGTSNSIALGRYGETWLDDQISIGGFKNFNVGQDNIPRKDSHGQLSYIPLKYHGEAGGYVNILSFTLPENKTLEYEASLLFTKQINTGVASFNISPGIVKNYGYRDPSRGYAAYKKATMVTHHNVTEVYNNSQERIYNLAVELDNSYDANFKANDLEVTAKPYQYNTLDIQSYGTPIVITPKSDHSSKLKVTRGSSDLEDTYRDNYVIKIEPYNRSPYNTGAPITLGRNINHITECLYYRPSGSTTGIIKFSNHGFSPSCPFEISQYIGTGNIKILARKDSVFDFGLPTIQKTGTTINSFYKENNSNNEIIYRTYIDKNIFGTITGTVSFDIYKTSGVSSSDPLLPPVKLTGSYDWNPIFSGTHSVYETTLSFNFKATSLQLSNKNWSDLDNQKISLSIVKNNSANWTTYGLSNNITAYIHPHLGLLEFDLNATLPLSGPNIYLYTSEPVYPDFYGQPVYFYPGYYINDTTASINIEPYSYINYIYDNFKYIDSNTLGFEQKQLCYTTGTDMILISYPSILKHRTNLIADENEPLFLQIGDSIKINNTNDTITNIYIDNSGQKHYSVSNSYSANTGYVYLTSSISGVGFSSQRSFNSITGSYTFSRSSNSDYSSTLEGQTFAPLISLPIPGCVINEPPFYSPNCLYSVPTGYNFTFTFNSGLYPNGQDYLSSNVWSSFSSNALIVSSSIILSSGQNYVDLPPLLVPNGFLNSTGVNVAKYSSSIFDFRLNNLRMSDSTYKIRYSGYDPNNNTGINSTFNGLPAILISGDYNRFYFDTASTGNEIFAYKFLTILDSNNQHYISNTFRSQINNTNPTIDNYGNKLIRCSDWGLLSDSRWTGEVECNNFNLDFSVSLPLDLNNNFIENFTQNTSTTGTFIIASGTGLILPADTGTWTAYGLSGINNIYGDIVLYLKCRENYNYTNFSGVLSTGQLAQQSIYNRGFTVTEIYPEIDCNIYSANGTNTGIFSISLSNKQNYHTLTVNYPDTYLDYFRLLQSSNTIDIHNNLNLSFALLNGSNTTIVSGIFLPNTQCNKHIINKPFSKIYNVNSNTFNIAVVSGYIPSGLPSSGPIILTIPKIYDLVPSDQMPSYHTESRGVFDFSSSNAILSNGIYTIEKLDDYNIYLYDFPRSFVTGADSGESTIRYNNIGFNITDDKFSLWGKNFAGDTILHPWRDVPTFVSDSPGICESGKLCIRFSGIPNYFQEKDNFWVDIIPDIYPQSTGLVYATGYYVTGLSGINDSTVYIRCTGASSLGVVLGMNIYSTNNWTPNNSYISSLVSGQVIKLNTNITSASPGIYTNIHSNSFAYPYLFAFNKETSSQNAETDILREAWRTFISGAYSIHRDEVAPTVVSILTKIPPFYYNANHPYYSAWNSSQATRGVNVWKNTGSTGISMMITGVENIQTDKNPNYGYRFVNTSPSISFQPSITGYGTSGNIANTGNNSKFRFALDELNKYLCVTSISGIHRPTLSSGLLGANVNFLSASDWTMNSSKTENTNLLVKDIDNFTLLGIDTISLNNTHNVIYNSGNNIFIASGLPQNSGLKFRFGLCGGASIPSLPPEIQVFGINSNFNYTTKHVYGLPTGDQGLSSYSNLITPYSNVWYIDLYVNELNNIPSFSYSFKDILYNKVTGIIYNNNQAANHYYINNFTTTTYSNGTLPWVASFDLENVSSGTNIGISGGSGNNVLILSSGLVYNPYISKWQGYIFGSGTGINTTYSNLPVGITGAINLVHTGNLLVTGVNAAYSPRISNLLDTIKFRNTGLDPIVLYFNYQKAIGEIDSPSIQLSNYPSGATISTNKISDINLNAFAQATNKELWKITIGNIGATGYTLNGVASLSPYIDNFSSKIISYDLFGISNVLSPDPINLTNTNWLIQLSVDGGGGPNYPPNIQLFNTPSVYQTGTLAYDYTNNQWDISLIGKIDDLQRYNIATGLYNIQIYGRDTTGYATSSTSFTYLCNPEILNLRKWYAVKDKSYLINYEVNNCCRNEYNVNSNTFITDPNLPTSETLLYKKYNPLINTYELRYLGDAPVDKWGARLEISNIDTEYAYDAVNANTFTIDVKGLDSDVISVVGLLKLKELETINSDYPPIDIINVNPEEDKTKALTQGDNWSLSFNVVGGLSNINFPPTILLSGLPSVCSGYFPDIEPNGPPCLSSFSFNNSTLRWTFNFAGQSNCTTGLYNISIKAFDSTGEDTAYTNLFFEPLPIPGPSVVSKLTSNSLFPNCLPFSGDIHVISPRRGSPCPYITGIKGWELIGSLPNGLALVSNELAGLSAPHYVGTGIVSITGTATQFAPDNVYPAFIIRATGFNDKTAQTVITLNSAGIVPIDEYPLGFTLYFPHSGYMLPTYKPNPNDTPRIRSANQSVYKPYPGTGAMICRSSLSDNNCPIYYTGIYTLPTFSITGYEIASINNQTNFYVTGSYGYIPGYLSVWKNNTLLTNNTDFTATGSPLITLSVSVNQNDEIRWSGLASTGTGLIIDFGTESISSSNVYSVFDFNLTNNKNNIYQLINISNEEFFDEKTQQFYYKYGGELSNVCDSNLLFSGLSPISGHIQLMPFGVESMNMPNSFNLKGVPASTMNCKTCLLGNGEFDTSGPNPILIGKMRPSMMLNITGNIYPLQEYDSTNTCISNNYYMGGGVQNLTLISGVSISLLPGFSSGEIEEICYKNCYESGVSYLSGIVVPTPVIEITDPIPYVRNSQNVAYALRCSFGDTSVKRDNIQNYRGVDIKYYIKHLNSGLYWNNSENKFVSTKTFFTQSTTTNLSLPQSIPYSAPILTSGATYELFMERASDEFPTVNINSYPYMSNAIYWIHQANDGNSYPATSSTYPGFMPIRYNSGIFIETGVPFRIPAQIIGGSGSYQPTITGYLSLIDSNTEVLDINGLSHNLAVSTSGSIVNDGLWNIQITGNITGLLNSYLSNYDLHIDITENILAPFGKTTNNIIPVTMLSPLSFAITSDGGSTVSATIGSVWSISFTVTGGNRPPRYHTNTTQWAIDNEPIVEIDGEICNHIFTKSYNMSNNTWSYTVTSANIVLGNEIHTIKYIDKMGYSISQVINIQV